MPTLVQILVQIYEVTSPEEAGALARIGVNHIGVLVGKGRFPREQSYAAARQIFAAVPKSAKSLSLSLADQVQEVAEVVRETLPDILHLGTRPDAAGGRAKKLVPEPEDHANHTGSGTQ
jgi:phosphoribosylanthranilate isomerase